MTIEDFSNTFDLLFNNLMSDMAPEVNLYEKSSLLTLAQEEIVSELYSGFETTEQSRRGIEALIETLEIEIDGSNTKKSTEDGFYHFFCELPSDLLYIVQETAVVADKDACNNGKKIKIKPERVDNIMQDLQNPFRGPSKNLVFRIEDGKTDTEKRVELISSIVLGKYIVKYIRRPKPILLTDFSSDEYDNLHIRGYQNFGSEEGGYDVNDLASEPCELSDVIQTEIIKRAVILAKAAYKS